MTFARPFRIAENVVDVAAVDRFRNETNRTVRHARVHSAAMITRRGDAHRRPPFVATVVRTIATRAVRRNAGVEVRVARAAVSPATTFAIPVVVAVHHPVGAAHRQARGNGLTVNRGSRNRRLHHVVAGRFRRKNLGKEERVRRSVRDSLKPHATAIEITTSLKYSTMYFIGNK